jgi:hypothetical protein
LTGPETASGAANPWFCTGFSTFRTAPLALALTAAP